VIIAIAWLIIIIWLLPSLNSTFRPAVGLIGTERLCLCAAEDESRNFRTCSRAQAPATKAKREGSIAKSENDKPSRRRFTASGHFTAEQFPRPMHLAIDYEILHSQSLFKNLQPANKKYLAIRPETRYI